MDLPIKPDCLNLALEQYNSKYPSWSINGQLLAYIWQQREIIERLKSTNRELWRRNHGST